MLSEKSLWATSSRHDQQDELDRVLLENVKAGEGPGLLDVDNFVAALGSAFNHGCHPFAPHFWRDASGVRVCGLVFVGSAWFPKRVTHLPMFPLGSVLFPHMPLVLRVFEQRYVVLLSRVLQEDEPEFGVVLIERGQEVGGGEQRFRFGTVARIMQLDAGEEFFALVAEGGRRFEVVDWLDEDPHPQAEIRDLPDLEWDESLAPLREGAEQIVRRVLSKASEFTDGIWSADVEFSDDPVAAAWQLAAVAPLGSIDQLSLLRSSTVRELLDGIIEFTTMAEETLTLAWTAGADDGEDGDGEDDRADD